jgi:hypothetical protein
MPLELEPADDDEDAVGAAAPEGLEDGADGFAAGVDELEEFEPQAATSIVANTSRTAATRRGDLVVVAFMDTSSVRCLKRTWQPASDRCLTCVKECSGARWAGLYGSGSRARR